MLLLLFRNNIRLSSARAYLREPQVRSRQNLHITLNSTATKIIIEEKEGKKTAVAVDFIQNQNGKQIKRQVKIKKEVIVCGGAINSPQILLLSGIGPKVDLDRVGIPQTHQLPGVGKNLHNHVSFSVRFQLLKEKEVYDLNWASVGEYFFNKSGPMASSGMAQLTGRINTKYSKDQNYPDLQIMFDGYNARCSPSGRINEPVKSINTPREVSFVPLLLRAKSRGYLTLKSNNPFEYPLIYANYLTNTSDILILLEGIRFTQKLGSAKYLKEKYRIVPKNVTYGDCNSKYREDSDDFWICAIKYGMEPENHQAGTCKMGPESDEMAVVNAKLQVHGVPNIRVMDASVMPFMVSANPHANVVMIAERGVKFVKNAWLVNSKKN